MMPRYAIVFLPLQVSSIYDPIDTSEEADAKYHDRPNSGRGPWEGI
jgi:hypothetical protein